MGFVIGLILGLTAGIGFFFAVLKNTRDRIAQERRANIAQLDVLRKERAQLSAYQQELQRRSQAFDLDLQTRTQAFDQQYRAFAAQHATYEDLRIENTVLKRDLRNIELSIRKTKLDQAQFHERQTFVNDRAAELAKQYLKDQTKWIGSSLNSNNFIQCKQRLQASIDRCRGIDFEISAQEEASLHDELRKEFERVVRVAFEREEQARIKAQIREEQLREKETDRELKQLAREQEAIQNALNKALTEAHDQHSAEVEQLRARLAEAEARSQRAISQAQLTKAGHVYIISNIGTFGEGVYKIGMTRRLEPLDRIRELGDASVPFPFDVHMMISCDDAPSLENALHRTLHKRRLNRINHRKEFFRTDIESIIDCVKKHHGEVDYIADAEALEYRQSTTMTDDDMEFVDSVYNELEDDGRPVSLSE
jgi:hypothetical protein